MNDKTKYIEMMKYDKYADDADCWDLRRFLRDADATTGTKSPKDFNMDNPLQAAGAARGIGATIINHNVGVGAKNLSPSRRLGCDDRKSRNLPDADNDARQIGIRAKNLSPLRTRRMMVCRNNELHKDDIVGAGFARPRPHHRHSIELHNGDVGVGAKNFSPQRRLDCDDNQTSFSIFHFQLDKT